MRSFRSSSLRFRINVLATSCEMASCTANTFVNFSLKFPDQSTAPSPTRSRRAVTRRVSASRCTVPSRTASTRNCRPVATESCVCMPAYFCTASVGRTRIRGMLPIWVINVSAKPILRYPSAESAVSILNGSTAIVLICAAVGGSLESSLE